MNERQQLVVAATQDDWLPFAARRSNDETDLKLWHYLAQSSPNGVWVAKDEQTPIAVAIAHEMEDEWYLSEIYVEPGFRATGIGHDLLVAVAKDSGPVTRSGLLDPNETGGLAFFVRRGVSIQTPVLSITGTVPREEELVRMAAGDYRFTTAMLDPVEHRMAINALDREIRGCARPLDHQFFAANGHGVAFYLNNEFVGYAYVWANGRIGPMCAFSPAYLVQFFAFALVALTKVHGATWCTMLVPGTNIRVVRAAMRAGLTIDGVHLFASDGALLDLSRYVGFHRLLF
jgi:GNAT superfamily N-acetyltransferase